MIVAGIFLLLVYSAILLWHRLGDYKVKTLFYRNAEYTVQFSIVVAFRNEENNLPILLQSLLNLDYPSDRFELLLVDDDSTDNSRQIIKQTLQKKDINWQIITPERISNSPKKDAVTTGVKQAKFDWIVTTDADCKVPVNWLVGFSHKVSTVQPLMICGQVFVEESKDFFSEYQKFEMLALQGITKGSFGWNRPMLCNGANFAYSRDAFLEVNGFEGNNNMASGDDVFLMQKFRESFNGQVFFLKDPEHTVITTPVKGFGNMLAQRIRWAAKTTKMKGKQIKWTGLFILLMNLWLIVGLVYFPLFNREFILEYLLFWFIKLVFDDWFATDSAESLRPGISRKRVFLVGLVYPFISSYIAVRSLFGGYRWKGRDFKR
ncbi:glycosyltransferase [Aureitalea sp. L0-47]|uniref:glycosyltransferase family 2 protein n=1 Tax=Aureitalea sp. L0-47 TaxID=2816962 RepID=UPI002237490A|nr:glycosyltransferase [Aureitalea sp. L0-47]MCW5518572.1 glycosyltransferase [Aureitalea sp. L0-47]